MLNQTGGLLLSRPSWLLLLPTTAACAMHGDATGNCALACSPQMMHLPLWFKSLVYSEIYLQLPFFFVATYAFIGEPHFACCCVLNLVAAAAAALSACGHRRRYHWWRASAVWLH